MKKNLYDIMNEADGKELEALITGVEYENADGISAENIASKVKNKRRKAEKRSRAAFVRYGAIAACMALVISLSAGPLMNLAGGSAGTTAPANTELGLQEIVTVPSIGYPTSISYVYYLPLENGECLAKEVLYKLDKGKLNKTWAELLAPFFEHCGTDVRAVDWKLDTVGEKTEVSDDGQIVTHTPGVKTLTIYLEGTAELDDHTLKCLVNTLDSISYVKYFKIVYGGKYVSIDGKCPEEGFTRFGY